LSAASTNQGLRRSILYQHTQSARTAAVLSTI
jgi:hypothetical protein